MSNRSASAFLHDGVRTWTCFLMKSQDGDFRWLDRTLLVPTTDLSGVLAPRLAPPVFKGIYKHGTNPDGKYWLEFDGSGKKFNLLERVCERVPKSREWLLRDFLLYTKPGPPSILASRTTLLVYLNQRNLAFVPSHVVRAIDYVDPVVLFELEARCLSALQEAATPSTLLFLFAFLHELTWRRGPQTNEWAKILADIAVDDFGVAMATRGFEGADALARSLCPALQEALSSLAAWGDRCAPSPLPAALKHIPSRPYLMPRSQEVFDACACLALYRSNRTGRQLPRRYRQYAREHVAPSDDCLENALQLLRISMLNAHDAIACEYESSLLITPAAHNGGTNDSHKAVTHHRVSRGHRGGLSYGARSN